MLSDILGFVLVKSYVHNQDFLIPPSWDDKIYKNHPIRIVIQVVES